MSLAPALGGFVLGLVVGVLVAGPAVAGLAVASPVLFAAGAAAAGFAAGLLLGRRSSPRPREVRLTGRVFEFPQGPVMVEVALRRMGSVLPTRVTRSE